MGRIGMLAAVLLAAPAPAASAAAWTPPLELRGADGAAAVAVDADGTATIATGGTLPRIAQRSPGGTFGTPLAVAPLAPGPPRSVDVAAAGHGALAFAWQDGARRVVAVARDPGGLVGAPRTLSAGSAHSVEGPQVAVDARGGALVTWLGRIDGAGRGVLLASYRAPGGVFGPPRRLALRLTARPPALAMNAAGLAVVAWEAGGRVEAASVDHGRVGRPTALGPARRDARPAVAVAGDGTAVVAWRDAEGRVVTSARRPGGLLRVRRVLRDPPRRWAAGPPTAAGGPRGETVVTWVETVGPLAQVVAARGARGAPRTVRPLGPHRPGAMAAAIGLDGRTTIAWEQPRGGARTPDVLLASAPAGDRFGIPRHVALAELAGGEVERVTPAIATGGGATVVTWTIPSDGIAPARVRWSAQDR